MESRPHTSQKLEICEALPTTLPHKTLRFITFRGSSCGFFRFGGLFLLPSLETRTGVVDGRLIVLYKPYNFPLLIFLQFEAKMLDSLLLEKIEL